MVYIVGQLRLVEVGAAVLAVPLEQVAEVVLRHETVASHVITVYLKASLAWVLIVLDLTVDIMIGTPKPRVVDDHVAAIDLDHGLGSDWIRVGAADTSEDIMHGARVLL